jgi:hypothetical protein
MIEARAASFDQHRTGALRGSKILLLSPALNAWPLRMKPLPAWQPPFPWKPDRRSNRAPMRIAAMCQSCLSSCSPVGLGAPLRVFRYWTVWSEVSGVGPILLTLMT